MNKARHYRNSLLSTLCIISWAVIVYGIFTSARASNDNLINQFIGMWLITIAIGLIGGISLHLLSIIKKRTLKQRFIYNLFATVNLVVGCFGMMLPPNPGKPTPYLIAASFTVGIIMYKSIFTVILVEHTIKDG